ncbi:MAG: hypothetical protein KDH09_14720 [Chrysiogenetes bacterium]|nr:hypothetical protein [Chrysiogenetes bacterium]
MRRSIFLYWGICVLVAASSASATSPYPFLWKTLEFNGELEQPVGAIRSKFEFHWEASDLLIDKMNVEVAGRDHRIPEDFLAEIRNPQWNTYAASVRTETDGSWVIDLAIQFGDKKQQVRPIAFVSIDQTGKVNAYTLDFGQVLERLKAAE